MQSEHSLDNNEKDNNNGNGNNENGNDINNNNNNNINDNNINDNNNNNNNNNEEDGVKEQEQLEVDNENEQLQQRLAQRKTALELNRTRLPVTVEWKNINYSLPVNDPTSRRLCCKPKIDKQILRNINGKAKPGELVAIMGPSGSGKTTLINCLAGRIEQRKGSRLEGQILINGVDYNVLGNKFARLAAFVQQDDVLFSMQTVRETLETAAKFRLPSDMPLSAKQERVSTIISELNLKKAENTLIGDAKIKGVSGGERKRTNIGVELMQDPSLIFLDEPTSGLDSFQALNVVQTLKALCTSGCTIIMSIHQPRSSVYALFDRLILMANGSIVYNGKAGQHAVDYFSKFGLACPPYFNPADYFLDIVSHDSRNPEASEKRLQVLIDEWKKHDAEKTEKIIHADEALRSMKEASRKRSGFAMQFEVLTRRGFLQVFRNRFALIIRLFFSLLFSLILAAVYSETGYNQKSIQDRTGILFFVVVNQSFQGMIGTVQVFTVEKPIVTRERQSKSYYVSAYYITKVMTAFPTDVLYPIIFASVLYWAVNLNDSGVAFVLFLVIIVFTSLSAIALGFLIAAMAPSVEAANVMASPIMILQIMFAGFYINLENIPIWLRWLSNLSYIRWAFMAFAINEFKGAKFTCEDDGACLSTGGQVLKRMSFANHTVGEAIRNTFFLFIAFHILAYLFLRLNRAKYMHVTLPKDGKNDNKQVNNIQNE